MKIAVIGTGISGNIIARMLSTRFDVHVFEANDYIGGHTNTVDFNAFGRQLKADTGFMVFNRKTYPNFCKMLDLLSIDSDDSDMSFSVRCQRTGLEYEGSSLNGVFAQRSNLLRPQFYQMLYEVFRFNKRANAAIQDASLEDGTTVGELLGRWKLGTWFRRYYLQPMTAAIWSSNPAEILQFPAKFLIGFMHNHGLLQVTDQPLWRTVSGGARNYVQALTAPLRRKYRLNCPVKSVMRNADGVTLQTDQGIEGFDEVVFATHADQTLTILADATPTEREVLSAFPYRPNVATLHTDTSLLPKRKRAWASWNYDLTGDANKPATVTYDLTRLQSLDTPSPVLLTLNQPEAVRPEHVLREINYAHPAYSCASIAAQRRHEEISGTNRIHYCGAYWGYGFHEDGVNSALRVAQKFNLRMDECLAASTKVESRIAATVL
ncbi:MAG: putative NAD/FAD-binding protein [Pirellulaceae bacterium]|jgi:predicted NAD/FAD-binding protein